MANALGTLFGDIASAIREKTGDTATMKPAQFPEKIAAIEAGGSTTEIKYKKTTVTIAGTYGERVPFSIGFKPDILLMFPNDGGTVANSKHFFGVGFSERISGGQIRAYISSNKFESNESSTPIETALKGTNNPFYDADETGFTLGMTAENGRYTIIAIAFE